MTRRTLTWIVIATVVLVIELGATIGSTAGEPFSPVNGWGETRPANALTFVIVVLGCAALALFGRYPLAGATIATASYLVFALLDHELGMFLPPMAAIYGLVAQTRRRLAAILCAVASLAAGLLWVAGRVATITEPGVALLAGVAFGAVLAAFFFVSLLAGEIVRSHSLLHQAQSSADSAQPETNNRGEAITVSEHESPASLASDFDSRGRSRWHEDRGE